jgi:hypothetical protein
VSFRLIPLFAMLRRVLRAGGFFVEYAQGRGWDALGRRRYERCLERREDIQRVVSGLVFVRLRSCVTLRGILSGGGYGENHGPVAWNRPEVTYDMI